MTKLLVAALLGLFIFSSIARASDATKKSNIEPIRIAPKQDRNLASEDDGFIPLMSPSKPAKKSIWGKRKPAAKCAGSKAKCLKQKADQT